MTPEHRKPGTGDIPPKAAGVTEALTLLTQAWDYVKDVPDDRARDLSRRIVGYVQAAERARTAAPSAPSGEITCPDCGATGYFPNGIICRRCRGHCRIPATPAPIVSPVEPVGKTLGFPYADKWGDMLTNVVLAKGHTNIAPDTQLFTHPAPNAGAAAPTGDVGDAWLERFEELLEDYAGARAETAAWNVTQSVQPEGGVRMPRPRKQALMAHIALRAHPQPQAVEWAVSRWFAEVSQRPLVNVHRRSFDDTWRQVIRHFGGDDVTLCGPRHDDLLAATPPTDSAKGE